jgi:hypothetical protein
MEACTCSCVYVHYFFFSLGGDDTPRSVVSRSIQYTYGGIPRTVKFSGCTDCVLETTSIHSMTCWILIWIILPGTAILGKGTRLRERYNTSGNYAVIGLSVSSAPAKISFPRECHYYHRDSSERCYIQRNVPDWVCPRCCTYTILPFLGKVLYPVRDKSRYRVYV